jgi:cytochrome c oxidase subunit 4
MIADQPTISVKTYFLVFCALVALLVFTVLVAFIPTQQPHVRDLLTAIGFLIAGTKAVLIILWFMHVKISSRLTWLFASAAFVWLVIMIVGVLSDYATREQVPGAEGNRPQIIEPSRQAQEYRHP